MKKVFDILTLFMIGLTSINSFAQTTGALKKGEFMVSGEGFLFSLKEPAGWIGDKAIAKEHFSDIVFYTNKDDIKKDGTLIQVYSFDKKDERTELDLEGAILDYKDVYENLQQKDFLVAHKTYKCFSKLAYMDKHFYLYTVYVNPGPKFKTGVVVEMHLLERPANEQELQAFRQIIASIIMLKG